MANSLGTVSIDLEARLAKFESDFGRAARIASKEMEKMRRQVDSQLSAVNRRMESFASGVGNAVKGVLAGFGAGALGALLKNAVNTADALSEMSQRTGVAVERLSGLSYAARMSGTSVEGLEKGLKGLARSVDGATKVGTESGAVFAAMGVSIKDASGNVRGMDEILADVADKFAGYEDGAQKAALAQKLFGKAGAELIPLLNEGSAGIAELTDEAERLGLVITGETAQAANELNDNIDKLKSQADAFANGVVQSVVPALAAFTGGLVDSAKASDDAREAGEKFGGWLKKIAIGLAIAKNGVDILIAGVQAFIALVPAMVSGGFENIKAQANLVKEAIKGAVTLDFSGTKTAFNNAMATMTSSVQHFAQEGMLAGRDFDGELQSAIMDVTNAFEAFGDESVDVSKALADVGKEAKKTAPPVVDLANAEKMAAAALKEWMDQEKTMQGVMRANAKALEERNRATEDFNTGIDEMLRRYDEEITLLGMDAREREVLAMILADEAQLREMVNRAKQQGVDIDPAVIEGIKREIAERAKATQVARDGAAVADDYQRAWQGATDSVIDAFSDFVASGAKSFKDFKQTILKIAQQLISQLMSTFLRSNLTIPVSMGGTGAAPMAGAASGGFGGGFGGGAVSPMGMAGLGLAAGIGTSMVGSTNPWASAGGGALAGASYGTMIMPGIGTIVGAVIGLVAGYLATSDIPSITAIGSNVVGTDGYRNLAPGSTYGSQLGGFTFASIDEVDRETRDELGKAVTDFDNAIAEMLDDDQLERVTEALADWNLQLEEGAITAENLIGSRLSVIVGTFEERVQDFVNGVEGVEEQTKRLAEALELLKRAEGGLFGTTNPMEAVTQGQKALSEAMLAIGMDANTSAADLEAAFNRGEGMTIEQIKLYFEAADAMTALNQATENFLNGVRSYNDFINGFREEALGLSDFTRSMRALERSTVDAVRQANLLARAAGLQGAREEDLAYIHEAAAMRAAAAIRALEAASSDLVTDLYGNSSLEVVGDSIYQAAEALSDATDALREFSDDLLLGDNSPLNGRAKLDEALRQLNAASASGDVDRVKQIAQSTLDIGRGVFASGSDYAALFGQVQAIVLATVPRVADTLDPAIGGIGQDDVMSASERLELASTLAQNVADLSDATGQTIDEVAERLGIPLELLADDLGIAFADLPAFLESLKPPEESDAVILSETIPALVNATEEGTAEVVASVDGVGEAVEETGGEIVTAVETSTDVQRETNTLIRDLLNRLGGDGRSDRYNQR